MTNQFEPTGGQSELGDLSGVGGGGRLADGRGPVGATADVGDRQTAELAELAEKLRALAETDPVLARAMVAELVTALNRATDGAFGGHLSPAARQALGITDDAPLDGLEAAWAASTGDGWAASDARSSTVAPHGADGRP